ncbi:MAG: hypothetical protein M1134_06630 [Actinobacteria bacterium]|nr:hypothetical protein [Actinomycetota bacterium]
MNVQELVKEVCPPIGEIGHLFYFAPETLKRAEELGIDGFRFYFLGRGGVLGDVEYQVVASAFGYFKETVVEQMWNSGREVISPRKAGREYLECARAYGRTHFSAFRGLGEFCAAAEKVNGSVERGALALYSGVAAEPLPDDLAGRAMQLVVVLREFRGSAHLLAVVASGLTPLEAHYMRRPNEFKLFGYGDEDVPALNDEYRTRLADADALTDRIVATAFSVLSDAEMDDLAEGVKRMEGAVDSGG